MILGINPSTFDIGQIEEGDFLFGSNYDIRRMTSSLI